MVSPETELQDFCLFVAFYESWRCLVFAVCLTKQSCVCIGTSGIAASFVDTRSLPPPYFTKKKKKEGKKKRRNINDKIITLGPGQARAMRQELMTKGLSTGMIKLPCGCLSGHIWSWTRNSSGTHLVPPHKWIWCILETRFCTDRLNIALAGIEY